MKEQILTEIGERLKNGEDLIVIKADLKSRGEIFDEFDINNKLVAPIKINISKSIFNILISIAFIIGLSTLLFSIISINSYKIYFILICSITILYSKYFKKYILEFAFDINKYFRAFLIILVLYFSWKNINNIRFRTDEVEIGILNSVNTN